MRPWLKLIREVLTPGNPQFKAHLARLGEEERRLVLCLQIMEDPAIKQVKSATDEAANF